MEVDWRLAGTALLVSIALMAGASAASAAWPRMNRGRVRHLASEGMSSARALMSLSRDPVSVQTSLAAANAAAIALVAALAAVLDAAMLGDNAPLFWGAAALALVMGLWLQLAAQAAGSSHPEGTLYRIVWVVQVLHALLKPLTLILRGLTRTIVPVELTRGLGTSYVADEELRTLVDAVEEDGALEAKEKEMIAGIFGLGERTAKEIMVPRVDMVAVEASEPLHHVLARIKEAGHSRIPAFEGTVDNIVGVVYARDLLIHMESGSLDLPARSLSRQTLFIPESKKIDELLREMQRDKVHLAIVLDEYGGTSGLVSIEDLLEEIVGEIQDEFDAEEKPIEHVGENEAILDARVSIHDLNDALNVSLEDGEYDTVGGMVYSLLGKIPVSGDQIRVDGLFVTVLSTVGKRVKKVRVKVEPSAAVEDAPGG